MAAPLQNPPPPPPIQPLKAAEPMTRNEALSILDIKAQEVVQKLFDELKIKAISDQNPVQYLFGKLMALQQEEGGVTDAVKEVFPHLYPRAENKVLETQEGRGYKIIFNQSLDNGFKIALSSFVYPAAGEVVEDNPGIVEALKA